MATKGRQAPVAQLSQDRVGRDVGELKQQQSSRKDPRGPMMDGACDAHVRGALIGATATANYG